MKFRMIGASGIYDKKGNSVDTLTRNASKHHGVFTLWAWNGKQWIKCETFIF